MSTRLLEREAGGRHAARSAGTAPAASAHPEVVEALQEVGIDASDHRPQALDEELTEWADVIVATCDDACPLIPGKRYVAWHLQDPKQQPLERVRELRDEIAARVTALLRELDQEVAPQGTTRRDSVAH